MERESPQAQEIEQRPSVGRRIWKAIRGTARFVRDLLWDPRPDTNREETHLGFYELESREMLDAAGFLVPQDLSGNTGETIVAEVSSVASLSDADFHAAQVQQEFDFGPHNGQIYFNDHGRQEKEFWSNAQGGFYHITPDGNIWISQRTPELVASVDPKFYDDPYLLFSAQVPVIQIAPLSAETESSMDIFPNVEPIDLTKMEAMRLQIQYDFGPHNGQIYFNDHGRQEKEFWSNTQGGFYHITPDGSVWISQRDPVLVGQLSPAYYEDLSLLFDAKSVTSDPISAETLSDASERVPYAKMHVTVTDGRDGRFTVQYQSPSDASRFEVLLWADYEKNAPHRLVGGEMHQHQGGTADGSFALHFNTTLTNYGLVNTARFEIIMYDGDTPVDRIEGVISDLERDLTNRVKLTTKQEPFDAVERGRAVEAPVTPALSIAKISGPNVLLHVQSPYDRSLVTVEGGGMFGVHELSHEGGTNFSLVDAAINTSLPSGEYAITLANKEGGLVLDTVRVRWDRDTRALSPVNASDQWEPADYTTLLNEGSSYDSSEDLATLVSLELNREAQQVLAHSLTALEFDQHRLMQNIELGDATLAHLQSASLYERSSFCDEFRTGLEERVRAHVSVSVTDEIGAAWENLGDFEGAVGNLLVDAVNLIIRVRNGEPENALFDQFRAQVDQVRTLHTIVELESITGIRIPTCDQILTEAQRLLSDSATHDYLNSMQQEEREQYEFANELVRRTVEAMRAKGINDSAALDAAYDPGRVVSQTEGRVNAELLLAEHEAEQRFGDTTEMQSRRDARNIRLIEAALRQGTDPRARVIVQETGTTVVERMRTGEGGVPEVIVTRMEILEIDAVITAVIERNVDDPEAMAEHAANVYRSFASVVVAQTGEIDGGIVFTGVHAETAESLSTVFQRITTLYNPNAPVPAGAMARHDTSMGRIFLGVAQQMRALPEAGAAALARDVERITGISAEQIIGVARTQDDTQFVERLTNLFGMHHGHIFQSSAQSTEPRIVGVSTDRAVYQSGSIRIFFDLATEGSSVEGVRVVLEGRHVGGTHSQLFVDISVAAVGEAGVDRALQFQIDVQLRNGQILSALSPVVEVAWDGQSTSLSGELLAERIPGWSDMTVEQQNTVREALSFNFGETTDTNRQLIEWAVNTFLVQGTQGMYFDGEQWVGDAYDADFDDSGFAGECKWWVDDIIVKGAFDSKVDLPSLLHDVSVGAAYEWKEGENVTQVAAKREGDSISLQDLIDVGSVISGDFVQVYGAESFGGSQHTMIIGAVTNTGVWVFDCNYVADGTPSYRHVSFEEFDNATFFTVYRLTKENV